jgi:hypothetical protein
MITWACLLTILMFLTRLSTETDQLRKITDGHSAVLDVWPDLPTFTVSKGTEILRLFGESDNPSPFGPSSSSEIRPFAAPDLTPSKTTSDTTTGSKYDYATSDANNLLKESSIAVTPTPSLSTLEAYGLMPIANFFAFTWTDRHTAAVKHTMEKLTISVRFVYDICRKLYHYPLDPP